MMNYMIGVLSYNHPDITAKCIESLLLHTYGDQIILTHHGSDSKNIETLKNKFPQIHHNVLHENKGFTFGANQTLLKASEFSSNILFLTNDIEVIHLPEHSPVNETQPLQSICVKRRNTNEIDSVMGALNTKNGVLRHVKTWPVTVNHNEKLYVPGAAFWFHQSLLQKNLLFDESLHTYWEDVDLSLRVQNAGHTLTYDSTTIIKHKIGKTCHKQRMYTFYYYQRNRGRVMTKHKLTTLSFYYTYLKDLLRISRFNLASTWQVLKDHVYSQPS